jgi:hypothetical protein
MRTWRQKRAVAAIGASQAESTAFFLKKEAKTLGAGTARARSKSFLVLFFKKERLPYSTSILVK